MATASPQAAERRRESGDAVRVVARFRPTNGKESGRNRLRILTSAPHPESPAPHAAGGGGTSGIGGETGAPGADASGASILGSPTTLEVQLVEEGGGGAPHEFHLDAVLGLGSECSNGEAYAALGAPAVGGLLGGFNGTLFAYGQTGSGKTHSLFGPDVLDTGHPERGVVPRACGDLFRRIADTDASLVAEFSVHVSYLEVHNEQVNDLLRPAGGQNLNIRESKAEGVFVSKLTQEPVASVTDMLDLVEEGASSRATAATNSNARSSRSHCVFTITVVATLPDGSTRKSHLHLVDLAGSETVKKTGATGKTLKEATKINASLSALGKCIMALTDAKAQHVPFRDSKLTRLLKDSLGGNTKTTLLVCASPHHSSYEETISTLRFAQRAKAVKTKAVVNVLRSPEAMMAMIKELKLEITSLQKQNAKLQGLPSPMPASPMPAAVEPPAAVDSDSDEEDKEDEMASLRELLEAARVEIDALTEGRRAAQEAALTAQEEAQAASSALKEATAQLDALHADRVDHDKANADAAEVVELRALAAARGKEIEALTAQQHASAQELIAAKEQCSNLQHQLEEAKQEAEAAARRASRRASDGRTAAVAMPVRGRSGSVLDDVRKRRASADYTGDKRPSGSAGVPPPAPVAAPVPPTATPAVRASVDMSALRKRLSKWGLEAIQEVEMKRGASRNRAQSAAAYPPHRGWM